MAHVFFACRKADAFLPRREPEHRVPWGSGSALELLDTEECLGRMGETHPPGVFGGAKLAQNPVEFKFSLASELPGSRYVISLDSFCWASPKDVV